MATVNSEYAYCAHSQRLELSLVAMRFDSVAGYWAGICPVCKKRHDDSVYPATILVRHTVDADSTTACTDDYTND